MMSSQLDRGNTLQRQGRIRLREYPEHLAADIDEPEGGAGADCFTVLLEYLAGCNAESRTLAIRAPIHLVAADDDWQLSEPMARPASRGKGLMRFDFPEGPTIGLLPRPDDPRVHLWTVPSVRTATIWFARAPTEARIAQHFAELENFLSLHDVTRVSRAPGGNLRKTRRGPFGLLTELSIPVAGWPAAPLRRNPVAHRRGGLHGLPAAS